MSPRQASRLAVAALAVVLTAAPASASTKRPPAPAPVTVSQVSLTPGTVTAGTTVAGTLQLTASSAVTVKSIGIAVRDAAGQHLDYPGAASNVTLGTSTYTYQSATRTFPAGTYTQFGFWQDSAGVYHQLASSTLTVTTAAAPAPAPTTTTPAPAGISGTFTLTQADEFSGTTLNTSLWRPGWFGSTISGPVNASAEAACYNADHVALPGDGAVHLKVSATPATCGGVTRPYTGSLLSSNPRDGRASGGYQFTYGVVEARVYLPNSGTKVANWPAVWTDGQNWPTDGEIDVMEGLAGEACYHFHSPSGGPGGCVAGSFTGWHTFAADWQPGSVTYYYDGVRVGSITTGITSAPMYMILDNSVSGGAMTVAPAEMLVDYVRVWQR